MKDEEALYELRVNATSDRSYMSVEGFEAALAEHDRAVERAAFDAGVAHEAERRDAADVLASERGEAPWDRAVARAKCAALSAWGGQCCKPSGHRGVHVADLGGTGSIAWGFNGRTSVSTPKDADA